MCKTGLQVFAAKATRPALAATSAAAEAVLHARWAALHAGLLPKGAYLAPGHPKHPDAGDPLHQPYLTLVRCALPPSRRGLQHLMAVLCICLLQLSEALGMHLLAWRCSVP